MFKFNFLIIFDWRRFLFLLQVLKMCVNNYFCIDKAKRELGYMPVKQNYLSDVLDDFIKQGFRKKETMKKPVVISMRWCVNIALSVIFTSFVLSYLQTLNFIHLEKLHWMWFLIRYGFCFTTSMLYCFCASILYTKGALQLSFFTSALINLIVRLFLWHFIPKPKCRRWMWTMHL